MPKIRRNRDKKYKTNRSDYNDDVFFSFIDFCKRCGVCE